MSQAYYSDSNVLYVLWNGRKSKGKKNRKWQNLNFTAKRCLQQRRAREKPNANKTQNEPRHPITYAPASCFGSFFAHHSAFFATFPSICMICNNQMSYRKADLIKRRPKLISTKAHTSKSR